MASVVFAVGACVLFFVILALFLFLLKKILHKKERVIYSSESCPSFQRLLVKGAFYIFRKQGRLYHTSSANDTPSAVDDEVVQGKDPLDTVTITNFRIDKHLLQEYKNICCPNTRDRIPICYLECLFLRLLLLLATSSTCLVSPLGLIHIKQSITQHQSLDHLLNGWFDLKARLVQYKKVDRGIEVLVKFQVLDQHGICVWEGCLTVLSRNSQTQKRGGAKNEKRQKYTDSSEMEDNESSLLGETELLAPGDMGIQYAQATGDWNPHHLYLWTARLLGYRAPIAHGMWTLARTLDQVLQSDSVPKRYPVHVDCAFKRPLFMPGKAKIQYGRKSSTQDKSVLWYKCTEYSTGAPHIVGTVQFGS